MTALRFVGPRWAWEPGSPAPAYASTSVRRTGTPPCVSTAFSSRGATSSGSPSAQVVTVCGTHGPQLVELLAHADRGRAAASGARRDGALDGEHGAHLGGQVRGDRRQVVVAEVREVAPELL